MPRHVDRRKRYQQSTDDRGHFITLSVQPCVPHVGSKAHRHAGLRLSIRYYDAYRPTVINYPVYR